MDDKRESGGAVTGIVPPSIVLFNHASDHIFIDV